MGFLGTRASTAADINLIVQLAIIALLAVGWAYGRNKKKIRMHGQLMVVAVLVNSAAIAFVMVPSLILGLGTITSNPIGPGSLISVAHPVIGTVAWLIGAYLSWTWGLKPATVECFKRKRLMKPVTYLWILAAVLGVGFYVYYYIL
jgi:hypothetical protein